MECNKVSIPLLCSSAQVMFKIVQFIRNRWTTFLLRNKRYQSKLDNWTNITGFQTEAMSNTCPLNGYWHRISALNSSLQLLKIFKLIGKHSLHVKHSEIPQYGSWDKSVPSCSHFLNKMLILTTEIIYVPAECIRLRQTRRRQRPGLWIRQWRTWLNSCENAPSTELFQELRWRLLQLQSKNPFSRCVELN